MSGEHPGVCFWAYLEDGSAHFIPGCYGAIHDPAQCTCTVPGSELEKLRNQIEIKDRTIKHMREAQGQSGRIREWYQRRIDKLQARLDEYKPRTMIKIDTE